jgi:hypothetical protein
MGYSTAKPELEVIVDGETLNASHFMASFEMNAIPRAWVRVAVGREVQSLSPAKIHEIANDLNFMKPVEVRMKMTSLGGTDPEDWPGEFRIFDGFATGIVWERSHSGASFVLNLTHWLQELNFSSSLSPTSHPNNPFDFAFDAAYPLLGGGEGGGGLSINPMTNTQISVAEAITTNFWEDGLKPWFLDLSMVDTINPEIIAEKGGPPPNDGAKEALEKIVSVAGNCGAPLALDPKEADTEALIEAVANDIAEETYNTFFNYTFWDKLIGQFAPSYKFAIVPRVEDALVVPFAAGLQEEHIEIKADEYNYARLQGELLRPLRACGVMSGARAWFGGWLPADGVPNFNRLGVGGWFESTAPKGMIMLKDAPKWIASAVIPSTYVGDVSGADGGTKATALHPEAGKKATKAKPKEIIEKQKSILDAYAHALYVEEILRHRQGSLSGKLRFDICPGSTVKVEGGSDEFIPGDATGDPIFASVLSVTIELDSENAKAGTSFQLAHLRSEKENERKETSVERHPIWKDKFPGCALLDEFN